MFNKYSTRQMKTTETHKNIPIGIPQKQQKLNKAIQKCLYCSIHPVTLSTVDSLPTWSTSVRTTVTCLRIA